MGYTKRIDGYYVFILCSFTAVGLTLTRIGQSLTGTEVMKILLVLKWYQHLAVLLSADATVLKSFL